MLPYALKVVWFCLSLTGIIICWVVSTLFSKAIGSYWGPISYSVFATVLEVIFCLGMIYDMDPYHMPKAFCIAQTYVIYYSAWSLTGVCAAFTFATSSTVLWPSTAVRQGASTLGWKNGYYLPIVGFPLACLCVSVPVLQSVHAIQPSEDLHCDASHPEWGRFLGYAGFSMILTIPCLFLSLVAANRIHRMHCAIQRRSYSFGNTALGRLCSKLQWKDEQHVPSVDIVINGRISPVEEMPDPEIPDTSSTVSNTDPPAFGALSVPQKQQAWEVLGSIEEEGELDPRRGFRSTMLSSPRPISPPLKPNLVPAIWRLILFQVVFFTIQCLAALSTVIDVVRHRPTPTPFGTQHVALILVGWGPALVFGHLPVVRRQLMFWKR